VSLQAIRNALYAQLSTCSFSVLETAATCAIVYLPGNGTTFEEMTGTPTAGLDYKHWAISGGVYIRDSGDPQRLLNLVWQAHDDLWDTIQKDRRLGGAADNARLVSMAFDPRIGTEAGGAFWAEVRWQLRADELDSF
jgi:hypothetical protein